MMKTPSRKFLLAAVLLTLALFAGWTAGSVTPADPAPEVVEEGIQSLFPFPGLSNAYYTGTWCYISCSDGSSDTVQAFSTSNCCNACLETCGFGCVAEGGGPSVLCGAE